ncbi:MAG TPA: protein-disulfide reductase DsbD [Cellvibrio sp.]|nr:protein-disulfide reductase DsbD [Cellvibrio sp.]
MLIAALFIQIPSTFADDFEATTKTGVASENVSPQGAAAPLEQQDEFLPVGEAFKVDAVITSTGSDSKNLRFTWTIAKGYYLYQERFKFRPTPTLPLTPTYSQGQDKYDEFNGKNMTVFHDQVTVDFPLTATTAPFDLKVTSQGCADAGLCYSPRDQVFHIDPAKGSASETEGAAEAANVAATAESAETSSPESTLFLWQAIIFAMLGGMVLNLMPCVFPVLSIKVMSLVQADSKRLRLHGWAYTIGIILCFVGFASVLLLARSGGEAIGWGFQLQSPGLVTVLCYLLFIMGLSMSGMVNFGARWMGAGQSLTQKSGLTGSFFTGVLAALVASPCTAPFMGAALGFALTQPAIGCLAVFAALGFGMALPLLLLCYIPSLAERLPKPGVWMENLKEFLAFPLYLSAIWLLWVLGHQAGEDLMTAVCIGAVAIAFAFWLMNREATAWHLRFNQLLILGCFVVAFLLPWQLLHKNTQEARWQPYSPELLEVHRQQGHAVFIDLTADWCLTCLANERVTLKKAEVEAVFDEYKVVTLKGDWTNRDPQITALLKEYGRSGVPLYLWFPANRPGKADLLPQILTPARVIKTIKGEITDQNEK